MCQAVTLTRRGHPDNKTRAHLVKLSTAALAAEVCAIMGIPLKESAVMLTMDPPSPSRKWVLYAARDTIMQCKDCVNVNFHIRERGVQSVARFCYVFPCQLRGPAWAVGVATVSAQVSAKQLGELSKTIHAVWFIRDVGFRRLVFF